LRFQIWQQFSQLKESTTDHTDFTDDQRRITDEGAHRGPDLWSANFRDIAEQWEGTVVLLALSKNIRVIREIRGLLHSAIGSQVSNVRDRVAGSEAQRMALRSPAPNSMPCRDVRVGDGERV
jgi:hypothetical protein